jgi:ATP-dependent DNA helicase RecG
MILSKVEIEDTLKELLRHYETEWVEFKEAKNGYDFKKLGEYFSAISNEANLKGKQYGWLIFGVEDKSHTLVNTRFRTDRNDLDNLKKEVADRTNDRISFIEIYEHEIDGNRVVLFQIPAAVGVPTSWNGFCYGRDNDSLGPLNNQKQDQIKASGLHDWSRQICYAASINDLDTKAILMAREKYKQKYAGKPISEEVDTLNDIDFLNKAKLTINGQITKAALLLLGKSESDQYFDGYIPKITWKLQGENGEMKDYEHFTIPFLLAVHEVYAKIRNLRYRYITGQVSLFPNEVDQYDPYIIRELLHNCIAHQNYNLKGRINVIEFEYKLMFINEGSFIPGRVEALFEDGYVPPFYRNSLLTNAMVNLNMIDTAGSGVKRVYRIQRNKFFPLPDYDLTDNNRVKVTIHGRIIDENYSKLIYSETELPIETVFLLDRVQKGIKLTREQSDFLRAKKLIEGRYPNVFVSSKIAEITGEKAQYIHNIGMGDEYYKEQILKLIKKFESASRKDIDDLLLPSLPNSLSDKNKMSRIRYLINIMSVKEKSIKNIGNNRKSKWVLNK